MIAKPLSRVSGYTLDLYWMMTELYDCESLIKVQGINRILGIGY